MNGLLTRMDHSFIIFFWNLLKRNYYIFESGLYVIIWNFTSMCHENKLLVLCGKSQGQTLVWNVCRKELTGLNIFSHGHDLQWRNRRKTRKRNRCMWKLAHKLAGVFYHHTGHVASFSIYCKNVCGRYLPSWLFKDLLQKFYLRLIIHTSYA